MWKRDESARKTDDNARDVSISHSGDERDHYQSSAETTRAGTKVINIGKSVIIKGQVNSDEDLTIEGRVEGMIDLRQNVLTIGPNGKIEADLLAKSIVVLGDVTGNVTATERIEIRDNGSVDGDLVSPRVVITEGAHFRGSVDMQQGAVGQPESKRKPVKMESVNDHLEAKRVAPAAR
tara:strand:- start:1079 stop:1612 length:534 start_codon:yes stop_codon:yes gene_type:complete